MVIIDSSDSSSDEEDRRLRPLRGHESTNIVHKKQIIDVAVKPEVSDSVSTAYFFDLESGLESSDFQILCQKKDFTTNRNDTEKSLSHLSASDVTQQIIAHTKSLECFVQRIEQISVDSCSSENLRIGLKFINEFLNSVNPSNSDTQINACSGSMHTNGSLDISYEEDDDDDDGYPEKWYNRYNDDGEYCIFQRNEKIECNTERKQDASCQTHVSGEIIPREATAALEFFQELIKNA